MEKIRPLKRFGQNYIKDQNILNKIIREINPKPDEKILEIGPGLGSLTEKLISFSPSLTAVEIDSRAYEILSAKFPGLNIINKDFLSLNLNDLEDLSNSKLRIVGNIPYNLTSPIIFKMIENHSIISDAVIMVQNEVAYRMISKKGKKSYGILAVLLNYFSNVRLCFDVSPNVFYPKPKVLSSVVHIYFKELKQTREEEKIFIKTVKAAFGNRRKILKNSLANFIVNNGLKESDFETAGIDLSLRAEQIESENFLKLAEIIFTKNLETLKLNPESY